MAGRPNWLMIWVVYQVTAPSRLAAAISAGSAAAAGGPARSAAVSRSPRSDLSPAILPSLFSRTRSEPQAPGSSAPWKLREAGVSTGPVIPDPRLPMSESPPDRLSNDPDSPHYSEAILERGIGIRFNGAEKTNVSEYCDSEGWVRLIAGKSVDRRGKPLTVTVRGKVEPYFKDDGKEAEG